MSFSLNSVEKKTKRQRNAYFSFDDDVVVVTVGDSGGDSGQALSPFFCPPYPLYPFD